MEKIFLSAQERFFSREFPKKRLTEPGRPTIPLSRDAAVAQLDRATGYEPVGREFESLQPHQNFEGLMMNNHESFFRTRKSVPNLSAANRNRLMALLNAPSPFLPRRNPPSRIPPPRSHLLIGGLWGLKNRIPFKGKPFAHPIRYGCFLHGAISLEIATGILSILPPILTGSPVSLIPARSVLPAMSPGSAWEEAQPGCFAPGGLGRVGNDGREGGPSLSFAQAC